MKTGKNSKNSVMLKLLIIVGLIIILVIPSKMIESMIEERERMQTTAIDDVRSKWALDQRVTGPILNLPIRYQSSKDGITTKFFELLPKTLKIDSEIVPDKFKRGGYEVTVYRTHLKLSGEFEWNRTLGLNNPKWIETDDASLTLGISDISGITNEVKAYWGDEELEIEAGTSNFSSVHSGVTMSLPDIEDLKTKTVKFSIDLTLNGSNSLSFIPVGKLTEVSVHSTWADPKFDGNYIPTEREVNDDGFTAEWKISQLSRNYPQVWHSNSYDMSDSEFGVDLIIPMDDYKKSIRSAKYSLLTIVLTFLMFFLVEVINKRRIHPFQYGIVGLSLCLFYTLLVSISEKLGFNIAYAISTVSIVMMNALYSNALFKMKRLVVILATALIFIYGFVFITLQLVDYALIIGSILLTATLALTMYLTRNIDWYNVGQSKEEIDKE